MVGALLALLTQAWAGQYPPPGAVGRLGLVVQFEPDCVRVEAVHRQGPFGHHPELVGDCVREANGIALQTEKDWQRAFPPPWSARGPLKVRFRRAGRMTVSAGERTDALEADFCRQRRDALRGIELYRLEAPPQRVSLPPGTTVDAFLNRHHLFGQVVVEWPPTCEDGVDTYREDPFARKSDLLLPGTRVHIFRSSQESASGFGVVRGTAGWRVVKMHLTRGPSSKPLTPTSSSAASPWPAPP